MEGTNVKDVAIAEIAAVAQIVSAAIAKGHPSTSNIPALIASVRDQIKNKFD